jgi:hypothetical protein
MRVGVMWEVLRERGGTMERGEKYRGPEATATLDAPKA